MLTRKYQPLTDFLRGQPTDAVRLTPAAIATVLGAPLPPSAQQRHWWANARTAPHAHAWLVAGWRAKFPERGGGRITAVTFVRRGMPVAPTSAP